jgi:deoxyribonuclease IV
MPDRARTARTVPRSVLTTGRRAREATPAIPRIGIHTSTAGGVEHAADRAVALGGTTLQIFSSSPRQWQPYAQTRAQLESLGRRCAELDLDPLVVHASYLVNLPGLDAEFQAKSVLAFRQELERSLAMRARYVVLHAGSHRGATMEQGLERLAAAMRVAARGLPLARRELTILIENSAGAEFSLGKSFAQIAQVLARLERIAPVAACIDTCHAHAAGYDLVSEHGFASMLAEIDATIGLARVPVWHVNDAKAARGSRLDRHQHIGEGELGLAPFRRLLTHPALARAAFIAETPRNGIDDEIRNVATLRALAAD